MAIPSRSPAARCTTGGARVYVFFGDDNRPGSGVITQEPQSRHGYKGSCHCGNVAFEVEGEIDKVMDCNCSMLARTGALVWFVLREKLRLLTWGHLEEPMSCGTAINADTDRFFSRFAGWYRWRFRLFGFEQTQCQLIAGLRRGGIAGAELLEIGAGAGYLHRALLGEGAARATGVDLSQRMLTIAHEEAARAGLSDRTTYSQGDFTLLADQLPDADVTILDKVICCYPDWERLVARSLAKTRRLYAFTIPRDRGLVRAGLRLMRWGLKRSGCCYQPFIHDHAQIAARVAENGFRQIYKAQTALWVTQVYARG